MIKVKIDVTVTVKHEHDDDANQAVTYDWPQHARCPECGKRWCEVSPQCPKKLFNRHPLSEDSCRVKCKH